MVKDTSKIKNNVIHYKVTITPSFNNAWDSEEINEMFKWLNTSLNQKYSVHIFSSNMLEVTFFDKDDSAMFLMRYATTKG